jgi:isoquinoline 1-oxidoreductase beta subunit
MEVSRRDVLKASGVAAGGLLLGFPIARPAQADAEEAGEPVALNAFLRIGTDGSATLMSPFSEMGQGVLTAQAQLLAEELEYPVERIKIEMAPNKPEYALIEYKAPDATFRLQITGGSYTVRATFEPLRAAGARAREMLRLAAARRWGVPIGECAAANGEVRHSSGKRAHYGSLANAAAEIEPPVDVALKPPSAWRVIGRSIPRHDLFDKVRGATMFGIDIRPEDAWTATLQLAPTVGGTLRAVDPAPALAVDGVHEVVPLDNAVVVVADTYWQALTGIKALEPDWVAGPYADLSTDGVRSALAAALEEPGTPFATRGDAEAALQDSKQHLEAVYEVPFLAHMPMEPMNATAHVVGDKFTLWLPTQSPGVAEFLLSREFNIPPENIEIHTTYLGGGFGRRSEADFAIAAARVSRAVGRKVKLIWSREADLAGDKFGAMELARMRAGLDERGNVSGLDIRIAGQSIMSRFFPAVLSDGGVDRTTIFGLADQPYVFDDLHMDVRTRDPGVTVGFWRSVADRPHAFFLEGFLNEMAHLAGRDPIAFRAGLLPVDAEHPHRLLHVLRDQSGWDTPPLPGRARGVAVHEANATLVGQVFEISVDFDEVRIHHVTCVVDCGPVVNPDIVRAQMESGIVDGINMAFHGAVTFADGTCEQNQLHDFDWIGIGQVPDIDVHILRGRPEVGGVGEPGLPPVAPALAEAIFAATGTRLRAMPFKDQGFTLARA